MIKGSIETGMLDSFLEEAAKELENGPEKSILYRATAFKFIEKVVPLTPVASGRVRAGWTAAAKRVRGVSGISIGGSDHAQEELGRKEGTYKERGISGHTKTSNPFIEIFNGVKYVGFLELGSSRQAPSGMTKLAIRQMLGDHIKGAERMTLAVLRKANIRARRKIGLKLGGRAR